MADDDAARRELAAHERRLAALREKAALLGYASDPATTLEIADIEQTIATLRQRLGAAPAPEQPAASWLDALPRAAGDLIAANIGAGAQGVAVGKHIQQTIGAATADPQALASAFGALEAALASVRPQLEPALASVMPFQLGLLRAELAKAGTSEQPSASTIVAVGDWLAANAPPLAMSLATFFHNPAVQQALNSAGTQASAWVATRFPPV